MKTKIAGPVMSMLPLLGSKVLARLARANSVRESGECMMVVNPFAAVRPPALAKVIPPSLTIGDLLDASSEYFEASALTSRSLQVQMILNVLGVNSVNREKFEEALPKGGSLSEALIDYTGLKRISELRAQTAKYLAFMLGERHSLNLSKGLVPRKPWTTEVHLLFFAGEDVHAKISAILPQYVPNKGAVPLEVVTLRSPCAGDWLYFDRFSREEVRQGQELNYQWLSEGNSPVKIIMKLLLEQGSVHASWLGVDPAHIETLRDSFLQRVQDTFGLEASLYRSFDLDPETGAQKREKVGS